MFSDLFVGRVDDVQRLFVFYTLTIFALLPTFIHSALIVDFERNNFGARKWFSNKISYNFDENLCEAFCKLKNATFFKCFKLQLQLKS